MEQRRRTSSLWPQPPAWRSCPSLSSKAPPTHAEVRCRSALGLQVAPALQIWTGWGRNGPVGIFPLLAQEEAVGGGLASGSSGCLRKWLPSQVVLAWLCQQRVGRAWTESSSLSSLLPGPGPVPQPLCCRLLMTTTPEFSLLVVGWGPRDGKFWQGSWGAGGTRAPVPRQAKGVRNPWTPPPFLPCPGDLSGHCDRCSSRIALRWKHLDPKPGKPSASTALGVSRQ